MKHIVKRRGATQEYDDKKVFASVYSACINSHLSELEAEYVADTVTSKINKWVNDKAQVTSEDIRQEILAYLRIINKDIAMMYDSHLDIC